VHPEQIARLQQAADDVCQVAKLSQDKVQQLRQELGLAPAEYARLQAGLEADAFFRLMLYHNYPIEEAVNKTNAVYANALKDRLAVGGVGPIFPVMTLPADADATPPPRKRRGRKPNVAAGVPDTIVAE
jgi:hypothetical protein